jgi:DNA-directed RNA polymerase subunit RPC12/RpoP
VAEAKGTHSGPPHAPKNINACPHCDAPLSPWEIVLLSVDRALTCKHCWYRIILDAPDDYDMGRQTDVHKPGDPVP